MSHTDDPTATYRGYRRQALYVLFRLFDQGLPSDSRIQPEGEEDLAIYDNNNQLKEVIQVKDLSDALSVSSFKRTFFERIKNHCLPGNNVQVSIASFGPVGPELEGALSGDVDKAAEVAKKLSQTKTKESVKNGKIVKTPIPGLAVVEAENVVGRLKIERVTEPELRQAVIKRLASAATGTDPSRAFDLLMWWMLTCSENQRVISRDIAIAKLERIGKFLSARAAYHDQWNRSIISIGPNDLTVQQLERLEEGFYRGGRVSFDHVEAGFDVARGSTASDIHAAFNECSVVVLHSASGQGKTTQAYRYAKEFAPSEFRFEVLQPGNLAHARDMALAIVGHAEAIEVPTFVYVDVRPGDQFWVELVRELARVNGIRILVTIREEDWARTPISAADFDYKELTLEFDEHEASELYSRLIQRGIDQKHLDFTDAWEQFGARKTLFEFAYFITQHESLADRIRVQVSAIQREVNDGNRPAADLAFLRQVAVASAYEARVDLASIVASSSMADAKTAVSAFEDEYLIRVSDDGKFIEGFHAVRSEVMTEVLTDPVICPWHEIAKQVLPHIVEEDLESFLLCAFSRRADTATELIDALCSQSPRTWIGVRNVMAALMWKGLQSYVNEQAELLKEVHDTCVDGWSMAIDWDLAMAKGPDGFNVFEELGDAWSNGKKLSEEFRARQLDKSVVFGFARKWLGAIIGEVESPATPQEWLSMSEVLYWLGHLTIQTKVTESVDVSKLDEAVESLTTYQLGRFLLGVRTCFRHEYAEWLQGCVDVVRNKIRFEASLLALPEDDDSIVGHFLIDPDLEANTLRKSDAPGRATATIHDLTIERIDVLAQVFPEKQRYGAVGYGHLSSLIPAFANEADKPGVLSENLYPPWTPGFNARARGLVELMFRPDSWQEYFARVAALRQSVVEALTDFEASARRIAKAGSPPTSSILDDPAGWDACKESLRADLLLPKTAVDEWGFLSDSSSKTSASNEKSYRSALERFTPIKESISEYTRTVGNFMGQALESMVLISNLRHAQGQAGRNAVTKKAGQLGINEHSIRLSIINGIDAFKAITALQEAICKVFPDGDIPELGGDLSENELRVFDSALTTWCNFVSPPRVGEKAARKKNNKQRRSAKRVTKLGDLLNASRNRLKTELQSLRKSGIVARVISESIPWDGRSSLWIQYDVNHPVEILQAVSPIWDRLIRAFDPDRENTIRSQLVSCFWSEIILVPTSLGKSLDGIVMPHLKAVTYPTPPSFDESAWRFSPDKVGDDILQRLGLQAWALPESEGSFQRLIGSTAELFQTLDHLSDFGRIDVEVDQVGQKIFQSYLDRTNSRLNQLLSDATIALMDVVDIVHNCVDIDSHPNLMACAELLVEAGELLEPRSEDDAEVQLTLPQIVVWRDELRKATEWLGVARYFFLADALSFPEWTPTK